MSEKVKVTREQADAIERRMTKTDITISVRQHLEGWSVQGNRPLNALSLDEFIRALYIGYEVEPEFKHDDPVMVKWKGREDEDLWYVMKDLGEVVKIYNESGNFNMAGYDIVRHATETEIAAEKERRMFAENGRDYWELKINDVLSFPPGDVETVVKNVIGNGEKVHIFGDWEDIENVIGNFKVVCFAENRLDREEE